MTKYVAILGIDGSGKSTLLPLLSQLVSAELGMTAVAVGDDVWGHAPQEDLFRPGFMPDGVSKGIHLVHWWQKAANRVNGSRLLYPPVKLAHYVWQARLLNKLKHRYQPDLLFSDGNLLLSSAGRAVNYAADEVMADRADLLDEMDQFVFGERPLSSSLPAQIPGLAMMRHIARWDQRRHNGLLKLPDAVILLDVEPETALARLQAKHDVLDPHENLRDLTEARLMYHEVLAYCERRLGAGKTAVIDSTQLSVAQTLKVLLGFIRRLVCRQVPRPPAAAILGTAHEPLTEPREILRKVFNKSYLFRYLLPYLRRGGLQEITFPMSRLGRQFLQEGYSANIMQAIYDQETAAYRYLDRLFLNYPLHQAVFQRWQLLDLAVEAQLRRRLVNLRPGDKLRVLTAPSGYAADFFTPLARLRDAGWLGMRQIQLTASDLDPLHQIGPVLTRKAASMGIEFKFLHGDLTADMLKRTLAASGPFDLVMFIGLSSWISKTDFINYLKLVRRDLLHHDGVFILDCFTPAPYALSGKYVGYRASYYTPAELQSLLACCGFQTEAVRWMHTANQINHVCIAQSQADIPTRVSNLPVLHQAV